MRWADLEAAHGAEALAEALAVEVIERWERPDYLAVTLTPIGAWLSGVEVDEVWRKDTEEREESWDPDRPLVAPRVVRERVMIETPVWVERGQGSRQVVLPACMRIGVSLAEPERIAAPEPEAEPVEEFVTGEDGEPLELFAGPDGGKGFLVRREKRRRELRRQRVMAG